jgi:endonuclease G, mitochondrial
MKLFKKVKILMIALLFSVSNCFSQIISKVDTIIKNPIYTSYYSYQIEAPSFVIYKLWHGGGKSSRTGLTFKSSLPHFNYTGSGYDIGHMCNAEDFARNRTTEELTFRYYNAVPQTPNLNRGIWKANES